MSGKRVIIVGGGVIGMSLAWRLLGAGAQVSVIDAGAGAPPATNAAAGMLAPSFEHGAGALAEPLYEFSVASLKRWREFSAALEQDSGRNIDYRADGIMGAAFEEESESALKGAFSDLAARGARVELMSRREALAREPALSPSVYGAMFAHDDAQVDPRRVLVALHEVFNRLGGAFVAARAVCLVTRNGAACGVRTQDGAQFEADAVVIATGAFSKLCEPAPPVFPVKGEALSLDARTVPIRAVIRTSRAYLCPKAGGRLVVGASEAPEDSTLDPSNERIDALKHGAISAAPALKDCRELERWAGLRPGTPDGAPVLGRVKDGHDGLFLALGHYRNGVLLAPETAEKLTPLILDGESASALQPFGPDRF